MKQTYLQMLSISGLLLFGIAALPGCGGGTGKSTSPAPSSPSGPSVSGAGKATFTVTWPDPAASRLIPSASNSIVLTLSRPFSTTVIATRTVSRPAGGGTATATFENLPLGILEVSAAARPGADGSGTTQASAVSNVFIEFGKTVTLSLTLASEIERLEVTPATLSLTVGETAPMTVTAKNKAGAIVLIDPSKLIFESFITGNDFRLDTSDVAAADITGKVTAGVRTGIAGITIKDSESGRTGKATVVVVPPADKPVTQKSVAYQINASHSGRTTFDQKLYFPNQRTWSVPMNVTGSLLIADGRVFAVGNMASGSGLYAFERATGKRLWGPIWDLQTGGLEPLTLAYDSGTLIVGGLNKNTGSSSPTSPIVGIDPATGAVRWRFQTTVSWFAQTRPVAVNGTVYFGVNGPVIGASGLHFRQFAVDSATGAQRWVHTVTIPTPSGSYNAAHEVPSVSPEDGLVYFVRNGALDALDIATGARVWESNLPQQLRYRYTQVPHKGKLYTQGLTPENAYLANPPVLDARTGSPSGTYRWYTSTPAFSDTVSLQIHTQGLLAVDPATQQTLWSLPDRSYYSPIFIDDTAFVVRQDGNLLALEGSTGKLLWRTGFVADATSGGSNQGMLRSMAAGEGYLAVPFDNHLIAWHLAGPK